MKSVQNILLSYVELTQLEGENGPANFIDLIENLDHYIPEDDKLVISIDLPIEKLKVVEKLLPYNSRVIIIPKHPSKFLEKKMYVINENIPPSKYYRKTFSHQVLNIPYLLNDIDHNPNILLPIVNDQIRTLIDLILVAKDDTWKRINKREIVIIRDIDYFSINVELGNYITSPDAYKHSNIAQRLINLLLKGLTEKIILALFTNSPTDIAIIKALSLNLETIIDLGYTNLCKLVKDKMESIGIEK